MITFGDALDFLRDETLRDSSDGQLWTDASLCEFIAQAHDEFAERTQYIRDSSSPAATFDLIAGEDTYVLDDVVLSVISAKVAGANNGLIRAGSPALDGYVPPPDTIAWLEQINYGTAADGTPLVFTSDDAVVGAGGAATIRVWPTPAAADDGVAVNMRIVRLPSVTCSLDTLEEAIECPRQYRMALIHGAAARAYQSQDADGADPERETKHKNAFEDYVARAKSGIRRKTFQPLAWGFGRGGFSYPR